MQTGAASQQQPPNQRVKTKPCQQEQKAASPTALVKPPHANSNQQSHACPGTAQTQFDCNAVTAIATVRQANAAETFNGLAYAEIGVGILTAVVAFFAAKFAAQAVKAARDNLSHDKVQTKAQLRPWLSHCGFEITPFRNATVGEEDGSTKIIERGLIGRVSFINTGPSPALNVRFFSDHKMGGMMDEEAPHFEQTGKSDNSAGAIGPQRGASAADRIVCPPEFDEFMAQRASLWLYARVDYEEPGHEGEPYVTEITFRIHYKGEEVDQKTGQRTPIWWARVLGPQNTMK